MAILVVKANLTTATILTRTQTGNRLKVTYLKWKTKTENWKQNNRKVVKFKKGKVQNKNSTEFDNRTLKRMKNKKKKIIDKNLDKI